jgi:predicted alpha/beta-fold hydrolase
MKVNDFLNNSHLHTVLPIYLTQYLHPNYTRERLDTPDGDFIDLDWVNKDMTNAPTLILFHGVEGSSKSHYAKRIMYHLEQIGWRGVVPHFRGCSEELNRCMKIYHAGETSDVRWIIHQISLRTPKELFAAGVSLGGNMLLKFLGEMPQNDLHAAVAVSTPFDLAETTSVMDHGINKHIYAKSFLNTLMPKMQAYAKRFHNFKYFLDHKVDTINEFSELYLCQVYGFKNAEDYYRQSSCKPYLKNIITPTMILQSRNDPLIPVNSWPTKDELSKYIKFVSTRSGGHGGFVTTNRNYREALLKLPKFIVDYLKQYSRYDSSDIITATNTSNDNISININDDNIDTNDIINL